MKITLKTLLVLSVLTAIVILYRLSVFPFLLKRELVEIANACYFKTHTNARYCFSDRRHDGSEIVINQIDDIELKEHLQTTINLIRYHVGAASRVWIYVDSTNLKDITLEIQTSREWKESLFYFGDYTIKFTNKEILDDGK